jgi:transposase-like protein
MLLICPFCKCSDIRLVFEAEDGLKSYQCHDCTHTFHVTELQMREPRATEAREAPEEKPAEAAKKR